MKSNVVGLVGASTLGTVMLSPAMTLYGNFGPAFIASGKGAPIAFVLGLIATLPTAASFALLSREFACSGSVSSWSTQAISRWVGQWVGWIVFFYYFSNFVMQPVTLGLFFNDLFRVLGFAPGTASYLFGAILLLVWPARIAYKGISPSTKGALVFLLSEIAVVFALCASVLFWASSHGAGIEYKGLYPSSDFLKSSGLFRAMVFAMLAYCGFDVISTLGEEAKMPKKLIPQATFLSLMMFGVFIIAGVWALTHAPNPDQLKAVADSGGMPVTEIAKGIWGRWAFLVPVTGISAALGISIATAVGASRILFSMGRSGQARSWFSTLHPSCLVPWNAMHVVFLGGLFCTVVWALVVGPYHSYVWWGSASTFFAMFTYLAVNLANMVLNKGRIFASPSGFFLYAFVPFFGVIADGYLLVRSFFVELWVQGWLTGKSVVVMDMGCAVVALIFVFKAYFRDSNSEASLISAAQGVAESLVELT